MCCNALNKSEKFCLQLEMEKDSICIEFDFNDFICFLHCVFVPNSKININDKISGSNHDITDYSTKNSNELKLC